MDWDPDRCEDEDWCEDNLDVFGLEEQGSVCVPDSVVEFLQVLWS